MTIALLIALVLGSIAAHEAGHAFMGWLAGWSIVGVFFHPLGGFGFRFEMNGREGQLPAVAAGGLLASCLLAAGFFLYGGVWGVVGFTLNGCLFLVNAVPLGPTDGAHMLRGVRS